MRTLGDALADADVFSDGDWVESKDQDPDGDVRLVQLADIGVGSFLDKSARFMTSKRAAALRCTYLQPNDLLIARMPDPIGRACLFPGDSSPSVTVVDVCIIRANPSTLDHRWLMHWFNSIDAQRAIEASVTGTTRKRISRGNLSKLVVEIPPIEEQRRIASILDAADALRTKRRQALAKLDTLTQAIFIDMFGDPVANTKRWPKLPFNELCPSHLGKMLDQKKQTGLHLRPYVRNTNVRWLKLDLDDVAQMDFDERDRTKYRLEHGDVLICEGGEPGRAAVWRGEIDECYFQKAVHRGRPAKDLATSDFVVHLLAQLARGGGLVDHISSATIAHLTGERLKSMEVIAPPVAVQQAFGSLVDRLDDERACASKSLTRLDTVFASLQHRAFRGEL